MPPKPDSTTSGTVYERLLRGQATSREYVEALRREVRERRMDSYKSGPRRANVRPHGNEGMSSMHAERTDPSGVDWKGRTYGELSPEEQAQVRREAASQLQAELRQSAARIADALSEDER